MKTDAPALGTAELFVPGDWFDLMEAAPDRNITRTRCVDLVASSFPDEPESRRSDIVDVLMAWYDALFSDGVLVYGTITAPLPDSEEPVAWQVFAGAVDVPAAPAELDLSAVMQGMIKPHLGVDDIYTETFTTAMGMGFGFAAQPAAPTSGAPGEEPAVQVRTGLAGALTCRPGGGKGLLTIGVCLNPEHVGPLAGLIAVIAGNSTVSDQRDTPDNASG